MEKNNIEEIWVPVLGYEGLYEASSLGRIRSLQLGKIKVLRHYTSNSGYLIITLYKNGKRTRFLVQRLIFTTFHGPIPDGLVVDHVNNIKTDNRLENLQLLTQLENNRKAHLGRKASAETRAKMSASLKGREVSAETRAKIAATLKGRPLSEERKAKISATLKARYQREKN